MIRCAGVRRSSWLFSMIVTQSVTHPLIRGGCDKDRLRGKLSLHRTGAVQHVTFTNQSARPPAPPRPADRHHARMGAGPRHPAPTRPQRDWIAITVAALPGLVALIALVFAYLSIRATNDQLQIAEQGLITDRYNAAITNLGSASTDVQLGGIYACPQRLMQDSPRDQPTIVAVLCAFVRDHAPETAAGGNPNGPPTDIQAALTVVTTRNTANDSSTTLVDLSDTQLTGARLSHADLSDADLSHADLSDADLSHADLSDADLFIAHLNDADLTGADLAGAGLSAAALNGAALDGAHLTGADLTGTFLDGADLTGANFTRATLTCADFTGAKLTGTNLTGTDSAAAIGIPGGPAGIPAC